ncbi:MAG TPA: ATP synthase subunit I [Gallionella sp.]|nr:ATP synthase subunit I [Gallionella sp.]
MNKEPGNIQQQCLTPHENAAIIPPLLHVEAKERKIAHRVNLLQIAVTLFAASIAFSIKDTPQLAIAVLGGGGISVVNGALLAWRMVRAASHPAHEAHQQLRLMYFYAAERFLVVIALLCMCMVVLKLSPLALLGGFVLGQAVLLAGQLILSSSRSRL